MKKERSLGIDLVKSVAIFLVVILHAGTIGGTLGKDLLTLPWFAHLYLHQLALSCIPLFLMATGYLQSEKKLTASYYRGIIPPVLSYLVISALTLICRTVGGETFTVLHALHSIFDFTANGYAWYFEMYIGLFLLIPFLNFAYRGAASFRGKILLLATLAFLSLLPETLVSFAPYYGGGEANLRILPDYFSLLYPVFYYFLGCFLREWKPRTPRWGRIAFAVVAPILPSAFVVAFSAARGEYAWYMLNNSQAVTTAVTASAIFLALCDLRAENKAVCKVAFWISAATFETYLLSYIADSVLYTRLTAPVYGKALAVFAVSLLGAWILRLCLRPVSQGLLWAYDQAVKKRT